MLYASYLIKKHFAHSWISNYSILVPMSRTKCRQYPIIVGLLVDSNGILLDRKIDFKETDF